MEGKRTQEMAREMGGQMIFIKTDLSRDEDMAHAVAEAAKLGIIKYLVNIAGIQHIDSIDNFPMETYDVMQRIMLRAHSITAFFSVNEDGRISSCP